MRSMLMCAAVSVIGLNMAASMAEGQSVNPLATSDQSDQKEFEQQSPRILASPLVQNERKTIEASLQTRPWAGTPEGKATFSAAVNELLFSGVVGVLNADPSRPKVQWLWAPSHSWYGLNVPGAKYIMPNVGNVFRVIPADNVSHYEIIAHAQKLPQPVGYADAAVRSVMVVKLSQLQDVLPQGTRKASSEERNKKIAAREEAMRDASRISSRTRVWRSVQCI
jgi:hypothetical protein